MKHEISKKNGIIISAITVAAGFPSPAENYIEEHLDLNKYLIKNNRITINLAKTDEILLNKSINKSLFMSLYKKKILKNGKISGKRT